MSLLCMEDTGCEHRNIICKLAVNSAFPMDCHTSALLSSKIKQHRVVAVTVTGVRKAMMPRLASCFGTQAPQISAVLALQLGDDQNRLQEQDLSLRPHELLFTSHLFLSVSANWLSFITFSHLNLTISLSSTV